MANNNSLIVFKDVSFGYNAAVPILETANFSVRRGAKLALMGQNGAGKSTIFSLITGAHIAEAGAINIQPRTTIATARQVIPRSELQLSVREFFQACFTETVYNIDPKIDKVLITVGLQAVADTDESFKERTVGSFSGGQQARLLLASALIQKPDILLLDEPTNNLDVSGVQQLTEFLQQYNKTVLVISHDAEFLNAFTNGVLYLDAGTRTVEKYAGNYHDVVRMIAAQIQKEQRQNAQLEKEIKANKDKINYFANKGGNMRMVAKRMRDKVEEYEDDRVTVRKEDKAIRPFTIDPYGTIPREVLQLTSFSVVKNNAAKEVACDVTLERGKHLHLIGPNGIGKTTLLERLATGHAAGEFVPREVTIGYYRQDFSNLDFEQTVFASLMDSMREKFEEDMRSIAAGFLLRGDIMKNKIGELSEGQKGLVAFAKLTMERPSLLILDEPTNHINFRHLPVIAQALHEYKGALVLVSHVPEFVEQVRIDHTLDLSATKLQTIRS